MQFGRSQKLDGIDFGLPPLSARGASLLTPIASVSTAPWLRLGAPAFRHRGWLGSLYPANADEASFLRIYAEKLGALELNSTFYGLPSEATLARWSAETPATFRFCPKVPRAISHELASPEQKTRVASFTQRLRRLGSQLGPALFQLPETAGPTALPSICAALSHFPEDFALALEVRHPAWFVRGALRDDLAELLETRRVSSVITDVSGRRDACHGSLTTNCAFVRFVGEGGHPTDQPRSATWLERLLAWRERGLEEAYFFVHQPDDVVAPQLLAVVSEAARERGIELPVAALEQPKPSQLGLF